MAASRPRGKAKIGWGSPVRRAMVLVRIQSSNPIQMDQAITLVGWVLVAEILMVEHQLDGSSSIMHRATCIATIVQRCMRS